MSRVTASDIKLHVAHNGGEWSLVEVSCGRMGFVGGSDWGPGVGIYENVDFWRDWIRVGLVRGFDLQDYYSTDLLQLFLGTTCFLLNLIWVRKEIEGNGNTRRKREQETQRERERERKGGRERERDGEEER
eukprot:571421-Amorphochlora_amoeboformis.AAC.1